MITEACCGETIIFEVTSVKTRVEYLSCVYLHWKRIVVDESGISKQRALD
jgi:hypothetical protein